MLIFFLSEYFSCLFFSIGKKKKKSLGKESILLAADLSDSQAVSLSLSSTIRRLDNLATKNLSAGEKNKDRTVPKNEQIVQKTKRKRKATRKKGGRISEDSNGFERTAIFASLRLSSWKFVSPIVLSHGDNKFLSLGCFH